MSSQVARSLAPLTQRLDRAPLRIAFLGALAWLDRCAPPVQGHGLEAARFELGPGRDIQRMLDELHEYSPHVSVVLDPGVLGDQFGSQLPGVTLGVLVASPAHGEEVGVAAALDRVVSFDPALSGECVGKVLVWRAIPVPVSDALFAEVRPLRDVPRPISIGRSTAHREAMLLPAKHRCDLLHVVHGLSGEELAELLHEYDVGVYVGAEHGGDFDWQVGTHLAVGQLLIVDRLVPAHGLEPNIDYLHVGSPEEIALVLERLGRFPEMYQGIRVRGRLKAEQYRASRLFSRVAHDLLADVSAFGRLGAAG